MKKLLVSMMAVYYLVSWKQYETKCLWPELDGAEYEAKIFVVSKEQRFDTKEEKDKFMNSLSIREGLDEAWLDKPMSMRWGFNVKRVKYEEDEIPVK